MPTIRVKENEPFEVALRRFKRTIEKSGLLTELRAREFYEKPTAERKRKKAAAIKRHYKRLRSMMLPRSSTDRFVPALSRYQLDKPESGRSSNGLAAFVLFGEKTMSLKETVTNDMKDAMRAHDSAKLSCLASASGSRQAA